MPLQQTTITGVLYLPDGSIAPKHTELTVVKATKSGVALMAQARTFFVLDNAGTISFTVPRASRAWLQTVGYVGSTNFNVNGGVVVDIPDSDTATLEALGASVTGPTTGLTVEDNGAALPGLYSMFNFIGATVSNVGGVATIDFAGGAGSGTVTSFSAGNLSPLFTSSVATSTTTPALTFSLTNQSANRVFAGPTTGSAAAPTFRALVAADIPDLSGTYQTALGFTAENVANKATGFGTLNNTLYPTTQAVSNFAAANYQPLNANLTTIAGLTPTNDDILQRKAGAWTNRTPAQFKTDLALVGSDVGLGNLTNALQLVAANNLSDLTNAGTARSNLGLGSIATQAASNVSITGGSIAGLTAFAVRSSGTGAFDLTIANAENLTAGRTLTVALNDAARTLTISGNATVSGTNTGDQTSVSGNAGTATALQTARAIYGNNFDGTAALTQIIASTYGGTGNGFTKFSGPATAEKTFTLPNASAVILTDNAAVTVAQGGTGLSSLTAYALLAGGTTSTGNLQQVSGLGSSGQVLTSNGAGALPTWQAAAGGGVTSIATTSPISGGTITSTGTISLLTNVDFAYTAAQTITRAPTANTSIDGLILSDTTAASSGNQQYSPRLRWTGQGWKTTATAASQTVDWIAELQPVQGSVNPSANLAFSSQINGGGYSSQFFMTSGGVFAIGGVSASFPGLLRSGAELRVVFADASNFANLQIAALTTNSNITLLGASEVIFSSGGVNKSRLYGGATDTVKAIKGDDSGIGDFAARNFLVGSTTPTAPSANDTAVLVFADNSSKPTLAANTTAIYQKSGEMYVQDSAGNETLFSPHAHGSDRWIFYSENTRTGRRILVDMEKMVHLVERLSGQTVMEESRIQ